MSFQGYVPSTPGDALSASPKSRDLRSLIILDNIKNCKLATYKLICLEKMSLRNTQYSQLQKWQGK